MAIELTWEDLAKIYDKEHSGRKARTLPIDYVYEWAERQTNRFRVQEDGALELLEENLTNKDGKE